MCYLYVNENGVNVSVEGNQCIAKYPDGMKKFVPIESLESIIIMGHSQITTHCMEECIKRGINISYFSKSGRYFGKVQSTGHVKAHRQRIQCALYDTEFAVELAKRIITAKINNQNVVLERYERYKKIFLPSIHSIMDDCKHSVQKCDDVFEIMGYEGQAAKCYK